jgi:hypothetical protein
MVDGIDVSPARNALMGLVERLRAAVGRPVEVDDAATLVEQMHEVASLAIYARDTTLVIARGTSPSAITYKRLEEITGISDSTLHERVTRWLTNEGMG